MKRILIVTASMLTTAMLNAQAPISTKNATQATIDVNKSVYSQLDFNDKQDYDDASKGLEVPFTSVIKSQKGFDVFSEPAYEFLNKAEAPATVNPSLWRHSQLTLKAGIFKVTDRIYQARGMDLANMTIIQGNTGLILVDPLTAEETSKAALELYYTKFPRKPVVAVIFTHSHVDHYGGVKGIASEADVKAGKIKIIAPEGFLEEAISENVYAGTAMTRRAFYQGGALLPKSEKEKVDAGLGKSSDGGVAGLIAPTVIIKKTGEKLTVDGVNIIFQMAPNTEAPAEMLFYFPQFKAICTAEDCTKTLHQLYTLRGAQIRDAIKWWKTLDEAIDMFGQDVQVMFASHLWPTWGNKNVVTMLEDQRDMYKYINDRTLNLMNKGYTMLEVGDMVQLPESLSKKFYNRGYYGTVSHDAKAVYQRYLGFYSSNPSELHQLMPEDAAKKYVEYMGGASAVIGKAKQDFANGNYRWVAQVMNQVVFSDPNNAEAKNLEADALEQLGYQCESAIWRNNYLTGASELRNGIPNVPITDYAGYETLKSLTWEMLFDFMGIRLDVDKAKGKKYTYNIVSEDTKEKYMLELENSVLIYKKGKQSNNADVTITLPKKLSFYEVLGGVATLDDQINKGKIKITGDKSKLSDLLSMQDSFKPNFNIVTP